MTLTRPNPDDLLSVAQHEHSQESRGKLKIFFGASPGVGKTYTMLQDAALRHTEGLDVVIGLVESHGRSETKKLFEGFEILPRLKIDYHGTTLEEFDLDAALQRAPALIVVDELAHTNAEGCRHAKRWQDIKELLDRGIDVYTTLNVQHIESLNDVIEQITHVKVHETVPDSVLELANTIELVDLPPDDLLKRLQEGKVYVPEQAKLAVEGFFKKSHLVALRELALRFTAERVNDDVLLQRKSQSAEKTWPTAERLLGCVGASEGSTKLIRAAKRMATRLQSEWIAIFVDSPRLHFSEAQKQSAFENLQLAESLGADTKVLSGRDIVKEIIAFANSANVSKIILGKQIRPRWRDFLSSSLVDELIRHSGDIDIYIVQGEDWTPSQQDDTVVEQKTSRSWREYVIATGYVMAATGINAVINHFYSVYSNMIMLYVLTVVLVSLRGHRGSSVWGSLLAVLCYDFFFIPPRFSLSVADARYLPTLIMMVITTQVISRLTVIIQEQTVAMRVREKSTNILYGLSKQLSSHRGVEPLLHIAATYIADIFKGQVTILVPDEQEVLQIDVTCHTDGVMNDKEKSVAQWAYDLKQAAGLGTQTLPSSEALYLPLIASHSALGVLRIKPDSEHVLFDLQRLELLDACVHQVALALEVDRLQNKLNLHTNIEQ